MIKPLCWRTCREAEEIPYPKFYGVAYYDFLMRRMLFAPIPLNILVGWLIWLWHWVRIGCASWQYRHSLASEIIAKVRAEAREETIIRVERAKEQSITIGINRAMEWFDYLLANWNMPQEELLAKRKELLGE